MPLTILEGLYAPGGLAGLALPYHVLGPQPEDVVHVRDEVGDDKALRDGVAVLVEAQPGRAAAHLRLHDPGRDAGVAAEARLELQVDAAGLDVGDGQLGRGIRPHWKNERVRLNSVHFIHRSAILKQKKHSELVQLWNTRVK